MVAAQTLPNLPHLTAEQAEHWVAAALAEARALRQHDGQLYPAAADDPATMRTAEQLHAAWRQWADDASVLYQRVRPLVEAGSHVAGAHDLDYAIARARAMLELPPGVMGARAEQVRQGRVLTATEVRCELRLGDRG